MNTNDFRINLPQVSCNCTSCQSMCMASPCIGTPVDIIKLVMGGHEKDLARTPVFDPITQSVEEIICIKAIPWEGPNGQKLNRCSLLTDNGLCRLHDKGLKPTEGRILVHGHSSMHYDSVRHMMLKMWDSPMGRAIMNPKTAKFSDLDLKTAIT